MSSRAAMPADTRIYTDKSAQLELKRDVVKFMRSATSQAPGGHPGQPSQK